MLCLVATVEWVLSAMNLKLVTISAFLLLGNCYPVAGLSLGYQPGETYRYRYTTNTVINVPEPSPKSSHGVGFGLSAAIEFTPVWGNEGRLLVKVKVFNPKIHSVSRPHLEKELQALPRQPVFFEWIKGKIGYMYASEEDSTLAVNIKKGIVSMFQVHMKNDTRKETDASGECTVSYIRVDPIVTKSKTGCQSMDTRGYFSTVNPMMDVTKSVLSQTVFTIKDDHIFSIESQENYRFVLNLESTVATLLLMNQKLVQEKRGRSSVMEASSIDEVIEILNKKQKLGLYRMLLGTTFEDIQNSADIIPLSDFVSKYKDQLQPSMIGQTKAAYVFLEMVSAFRTARKQDIIQVLKDPDNQDIIGALLDAAAAAQTTDSQKALLEILKFDDSYYIDNPERYVLAAAFSTHPSEELLQDLLKLYKSDIPSEKLYESIGESLGAVVYTYCKLHQPCNSKIVKEAVKTFLENVETCEKPGCKPMAIRALANAGVTDTIPALLKYAEECTDMAICESAIKALRRMGKQNMNEEVKAVMRRIFFQRKRGYDTAVRSQALNIILNNEPTPENIAAILSETRDPHNTEYDVYVQARLFNLADRDPKIKMMLNDALKDGNISNYHVLAPKGKSLAFTNNMAETSSAFATYSMFLENSRAGIIKRSGMDVVLFGQDNNTTLVYGFGLFAAGLEALLGEEVDEEEKDITATAGMSLDLMEVSLRPLTFFTGSGGLMSAVWSAPSEPVSALQVNILLTDHLERIHLQNGLIVELSVQGALSLDLSGSLAVSLWNKNSKTLISNSVALAIQSSTNIKTSPFKAGVHIDSDASTLIDFKTDVDFYDKIKMCLQMSRPNSFARRNVTKFEHVYGFKSAYLAKATKTRAINSLSYPLPTPNNVQCRKMLQD